MRASKFDALEAAICLRNPQLVDNLLPGLTQARVTKMLDRAGIRGSLQPIIDLFTWKNGAAVHGQMSQELASPFPNSVYMFLPLDAMIADYKGFEECAIHHPAYAKVVGKLFPLFWDGSNSWLGVSLVPSHSSQIVLIHTEFEQFVFGAYKTFEDLLDDAIRANTENVSLECFSNLKPL